MEKISSIIKKINNNSQQPIENDFLLRKYIEESLAKQKLITFYEWECPPRILDMDKKGKVFVNYCVDLDKVFRGKKLDKYSKIPRVMRNKKREENFLLLLRNLGLKFRFVRIIADTNAYYLTPVSLKILGKKKIKNKFLELKEKIKKEFRKNDTIQKNVYLSDVYLFTDLINRYHKAYEETLNNSLRILESSPANLISKKTWKELLKFTEKYMGFQKSQQKEMFDFTKRYVATYTAEGIIMELLSKTDKLSNCVWLNFAEADQYVIEITNCMRKKMNLENLPMIFPK